MSLKDNSSIMNDRRDSKNFLYAMVMFYLFAFILGGMLGKIWNIDLYTLVLFISFIFFVIIYDLRFFVKYILFFYEYVSNIIGVFIIENNSIILSELGRVSTRYNALWLITFVHWLFFSVLLFYDKKFESAFERKRTNYQFYLNKKKLNEYVTLTLSVLLFLMLAYLIYRAAMQSAGSLRLDRFIYAHRYITGFWATVNRILPLFIPFIAFLLEQEKKKSYFVLLALYFIYMFLIGHKFGVFIIALSFSIPYFIRNNHIERINVNSLRRVMGVGVIIIIGVTSAIYVFMTRTFGTTPTLFKQYLFNRLAQQGQMWWAVFGYEQGNTTHINEMIDGFGSFFNINSEIISNYDFGIYKMMKLVTPGDIFSAKIGNYSRYAFSTDASIYYYLKTPGLILFTIVAALLVLVVVNWFWLKISENSIINVMIAGRFYQIILVFLIQSDFNVLFSRSSACLLVIYIFVNLYYGTSGSKNYYGYKGSDIIGRNRSNV